MSMQRTRAGDAATEAAVGGDSTACSSVSSERGSSTTASVSAAGSPAADDERSAACGATVLLKATCLELCAINGHMLGALLGCMHRRLFKHKDGRSTCMLLRLPDTVPRLHLLREVR